MNRHGEDLLSLPELRRTRVTACARRDKQMQTMRTRQGAAEPLGPQLRLHSPRRRTRF